MGDWAKDLLQIYWDKVDIDNPDLTDEEREEILQKADDAKAKRTRIERTIDANASTLFQASLDNTQSFYKDGAHEVLSKNREGRPHINSNLERELSDLFNAVDENK